MSGAHGWDMLLLYREHAIAVVRRRYGNHAEADDCVQDALLHLVVRDDLDPSSVRALLIASAFRVAIDQWRTRERRQHIIAHMATTARAASVTVEDLVLDQDAAVRLLDRIKRLPRREREVVELRIRGFDMRATSERLGLSYKTTEGALTRGRATLRASATF